VTRDTPRRGTPALVLGRVCAHHEVVCIESHLTEGLVRPQEWSHFYVTVQRKYCQYFLYIHDGFIPCESAQSWVPLATCALGNPLVPLVHVFLFQYSLRYVHISWAQATVVVLSGWTRLWPVTNARVGTLVSARHVHAFNAGCTIRIVRGTIYASCDLYLCLWRVCCVCQPILRHTTANCSRRARVYTCVCRGLGGPSIDSED